MPPNLTVVPIRDPDMPLISDIPNRLRRFADALEAGDEAASTILLLVPGGDNEWPDVHHWGDYMTNRELIGLLEIAKVHAIDLMRTPEE
jgi:hypothetical protein